MSADSPLVSVVMTVYNDGPFVAEAVQSMLDQTFSDFELIVVDDGAIDDSVDRVLAFADDRIRVIRQANAGLAAALNRGIQESRGALIARQDADDFSAPERLERQVRFLQTHPEVGVVGCNVQIVDEQRGVLRLQEYPEDNAAVQAWLVADRGSPFTHGAVMFRKRVALQVGLYRPDFQRCQDYDLWLRMAEATEMANLPESLYFWRHRKDSVGARHWGRYHDYARLALWCTYERRNGRPEPELDPSLVARGWFVALTQRLRSPANPEIAYELMSAQFLVREGRGPEARAMLWRVARRSPTTLYTWLLLALTFLPARLARSSWDRLRRLYRAGTWKR